MQKNGDPSPSPAHLRGIPESTIDRLDIDEHTFPVRPTHHNHILDIKKGRNPGFFTGTGRIGAQLAKGSDTDTEWES